MGDIRAAIQAFRSRFAGTRVEGLPEEERPSVAERLAGVDDLLAKGVISSEEYSAQRARILGEL